MTRFGSMTTTNQYIIPFLSFFFFSKMQPALSHQNPSPLAQVLDRAARDLVYKGVAVLPMPQLPKVKDYASQSFPIPKREFAEVNLDLEITEAALRGEVAQALGGFCASGFAFSWHSLPIRELRLLANTRIEQVLRLACRDHALFKYVKDYQGEPYGEMVYDRTLSRPHRDFFSGKPVKPTAESVHRDETKRVKLSLQKDHEALVQANWDDALFGGWVNVDQHQSQFFSCQPGSQLLPGLLQQKQDFQHGFNVIQKNSPEAIQFGLAKQRIEVPPNHLIIFFQEILHEVLSVAGAQNRLFTAYRLCPTQPNRPLVKDIAWRLQEGAIVPLKSGQMPPLYPKLYAVNFQDRLEQFALKSCSERLRVRHVSKSGKNAGKVRTFPERFAKPLGQGQFKKYRDHEIKVSLPHLLRLQY